MKIVMEQNTRLLQRFICRQMCLSTASPTSLSEIPMSWILMILSVLGSIAIIFVVRRKSGGETEVIIERRKIVIVM